jgi:hypothetical protein
VTVLRERVRRLQSGLWTVRDRFGDLPGSAVVLALFAVTWGPPLTGVAGVSVGLVVGALVVLVAYCAARPRGGSDVFFFAIAPVAAGGIVHDVFNVSRLVGALFLPFAIYCVWNLDRRAQRDRLSA